MVVTKFWPTMALFSLALLTFAGSGCGTSNSTTEPNALNCKPSSQDIATFQTGPFADLVNNGCLGCHGDVGSSTNYRTRFRMQTADTSVGTLTENLCVAYMFGQRSPSQALIIHPQGPNHTGGVFTPAQIPNLINWVNTYTPF